MINQATKTFGLHKYKTCVLSQAQVFLVLKQVGNEKKIKNRRLQEGDKLESVVGDS